MLEGTLFGVPVLEVNVLDIAVGGRYPLTDAAAAYDDLEGRRTQGKLLLIP